MEPQCTCEASAPHVPRADVAALAGEDGADMTVDKTATTGKSSSSSFIQKLAKLSLRTARRPNPPAQRPASHSAATSPPDESNASDDSSSSADSDPESYDIRQPAAGVVEEAPAPHVPEEHEERDEEELLQLAEHLGCAVRR